MSATKTATAKPASPDAASPKVATQQVAAPKAAAPKTTARKTAAPKTAASKAAAPTSAAPDTAAPTAATSRSASKPTKPAAAKKSLKRSRYTRAEVEAIFARLAAALPEPKTELEYVNPYTLLVAVVLSAQATDAGVNKATRALFQIADTPQKMVALGEEKVREHIKTIGLFNTKAKNVIALSEALVREHGGEVPADREALQKLPGVGRKTANVILNTAFGQPTIAVDTHIFRLGNRLGLAPGKTTDEVEAGLEKIVPAAYKRDAHHWLILHGRHVCKARRPLCEACVIYDLCKAPDRRPRPTD